jgi:hypothetical protein
MTKFFLFLSFFLISCQNSHLDKKSSSNNGREIEDVRPLPDDQPSEFLKFYFGGKKEAYQGIELTGFREAIKLMTTKKNDPFNLYKAQKLTTFKTKGSLPVTITHKTEAMTLPENSFVMDDFYHPDLESLKVEKPVHQHRLCGIDGGIDSGSSDSATKDVLLFSFDEPISYLGFHSLDTESHPRGVQAKLRLFDCLKNLLHEEEIKYPDDQHGQNEVHFIGFTIKRPMVCHVGLTIGDSPKGTAGYRAMAIDDLFWGK